MTHPSHPFISFSRFAVSATSVCLTLLLACGGTTENSSNDDTSGDGNMGGSGPTDGNAGGSGPTDGNAGGSGPTDGNSGGSGGSSPTDGGQNNGNSGGTGGGSNCPSVEPAEGTSCSQEFLVCDYVNCVPPDPRNDHTLQCVNGAWSLAAETACEDVPFSCPPNVYRGAYCSAPEGAGPCTVYDACGSFRDVYCTNGIWEYGSGDSDGAAPPPDGGGGAGTAVGVALATVTTSPPIPTCPDYAPIQGTPCCPSDYPAYCDYTDSGSDSAVVTAASINTVSTATVVGGAAFSAVTTGNGGGAGTGGEDVAPIVTCAVCSPDSFAWQASDLCP